MKARPILMSASMVIAHLEDRKTNTRRLVKNPDHFACLTGDCDHNHQTGCDAFMAERCPYGVPGDLLWVREAWRVSGGWDLTPPRDLKPRRSTVFYEAGGHAANYANGWRSNELGWYGKEGHMATWVGKKRPSIFMPRWASRLTLKITEIGVERLQDISGDDAINEGLTRTPDGMWSRGPSPEGHLVCYTQPEMAYSDLWCEINGRKSWNANPWVWVIRYAPIKANVDTMIGGR